MRCCVVLVARKYLVYSVLSPQRVVFMYTQCFHHNTCCSKKLFVFAFGLLLEVECGVPLIV
jgi:hypothetical protein